MSRTVIDLGEYATQGVGILAGRERGALARKTLGLDGADKRGVEFEVRVPSEIISVNSSFFLGMFGESVRALGEATFRKRYAFVGGPDADRIRDEGIRKALRTGSPLPSS